MRRLFRRLACWVLGHKPKQTEVYHIEYRADGYHTEGWYVHVCTRCGRRIDASRA